MSDSASVSALSWAREISQHRDRVPEAEKEATGRRRPHQERRVTYFHVQLWLIQARQGRNLWNLFVQKTDVLVIKLGPLNIMK